jgi:dTDP-4-dehydrorhamnose 3,5-epimerase
MELLRIKKKTLPKELLLFKRPSFMDSRGDFQRIFDHNFFSSQLLVFKTKQINFSYNKLAGTIRGLHFQIPSFNENKIISCISGKIFDVIVDVRKKSKNYLKSYNVILSSKNKLSLFIPAGYAHGFQSLEDKTQIVYLHTKTFNKSLYRVINPFDKNINIKWKLKKFIISKQDKNKRNIDLKK